MAPSEANVLITGESGVGKEVIANVIHNRSRRAEKPMVKLNCAAFPQTMIEGELFGYVKGAFTGATNDFPRHDRGSGGQHAFPRRDFRDAGGIANPLFARPAGAGISTVRQHEDTESRFSGRRGDQSPDLTRRSRRIASAPIFIIGLILSKSNCRRCESGKKTSHRWSPRF